MASPDYALKSVSPFGRDVYEGLSARQKFLPAKYLYDEIGSALFEVITLLPEYGLTRAEERVLHAHATTISETVGMVTEVAELGSGSGRKTERILQALLKRQESVHYTAIDVSSSALENCCNHLAQTPGVRTRSIQSSYLDGLARVQRDRTSGGRFLLLFLGSSIGNFSDAEVRPFLKRIREGLRTGDAFLVGTDLVKPEAQLLNAYNDETGVTSAFNLNVLARINRELGGDFCLRKFQHDARWNIAKSRVEMHLVSRERQRVHVVDAHCTAEFEKGESIWTESSQKFSPFELREIALACGFEPVHQWIDPEWAFAENLWIAN